MRLIKRNIVIALLCSVCVLVGLGAVWGCSGPDSTSGLLNTTERAQEAADEASTESSTAASTQQSTAASTEKSTKTKKSTDKKKSASTESSTASSSKSSSTSQEKNTSSQSSSSKKSSSSSSSSKKSSNKSKSSDSSKKSDSSSKQDESKQEDDALTVEVKIDSANAHKYDSKWPETYGTFTVEIEEGDTVYDALVSTGVKFTEKNGNYIDSIGGLAEKVCGSGSGWMYSVDGVFPGISAMKYELKGGEDVRWAYTVTMGDL